MFQIIDDALNLEENDLSKNKGFIGEDISEGKNLSYSFESHKSFDEIFVKNLRSSQVILILQRGDDILV